MDKENNVSEVKKGEGRDELPIYQLLTDPGTLKGGLNLFKQRVTNKIDNEEFEARLEGTYKKKERTLRSNSDVLPSPTSSRGKSKKRTNKILKMDKSLEKADLIAIARRTRGQSGSSGTNGTSRTRDSKVKPSATATATEETSEQEEIESIAGETQFGKLLKLLPVSSPKKYIEDQFDFRPSQLMKSVFPHYEEKQRVYAVHVENTKKMTIDKLRESFEYWSSDLLDIFEGRSTTTRMKLYCSHDEEDRGRLKSLNVVDPFENQQVVALASFVVDLLLPDVEERLKYGNFIKLVMIPETLIRVYASLNEINFEMAEKEMKWGPRYDGPVSTAKQDQSQLF